MSRVYRNFTRLSYSVMIEKRAIKKCQGIKTVGSWSDWTINSLVIWPRVASLNEALPALVTICKITGSDNRLQMPGEAF